MTELKKRNSADRALNRYRSYRLESEALPRGGSRREGAPVQIKSTQTRNTERLRIQARLEVVDQLKGYTATNAEEEAYSGIVWGQLGRGLQVWYVQPSRETTVAIQRDNRSRGAEMLRLKYPEDRCTNSRIRP